MNNEFKLGDIVRIKLDPHSIAYKYNGREGTVVRRVLLDSSEYYYSVYIQGAKLDVFRPSSTDVIGKESILEPLFEDNMELIKD